MLFLEAAPAAWWWRCDSPPIIDCVSNFGLFDVDSTHAARQPHPGVHPASQGAVWSGRGEQGNHTAAVVSLPCGWLLL